MPLLWAQRQPLLKFSILFRLIESLLFAPLAGLVGQALSGRPVVDSTALVAFVLSPRGFAAVLFGAVSLLTIRLIEHAGLSLITWGALEGRAVPALAALRYVLMRLAVLIRICMRYVVTGVAIVAPLAIVAALLAKPLLIQHDINFYLAERPAEFVRAAVIVGLIALVCGIVALSLVVRWRWSAQACLFEADSVPQGFARSTALTHGVRVHIALATLVSTVFSLALGLLASGLGSAATIGVVRLLGDRIFSVVLALPLLLTLRAIIGSWATVAGSCIDAGYFTALFFERQQQLDGAAISLPAIAKSEATRMSPATRRLSIAAILGVVGFAWAGILVAAVGLFTDRPVEIHAHRGGTLYAPENTLAAVREAAEAGADYVETDVQQSKDGALIINHDSDFSRVAGVAKRVWELSLDEIRALSPGRNAGPEFQNERIATLDEFLAESKKDGIRVNIELKYYGGDQTNMAAQTVNAVRQAGMIDQVVVQSLEYEPLLEVRKLAPEVPIGYLMSVNARRPARLDVDFLSVEQNRIDGAFVMRTHRRGQKVYVWTANTAEEIERAFDLGVDGIITDQSALAFELRRAYNALHPAERMARRLKAWLAA